MPSPAKGEIVARVGEATLPLEAVERVAREQRISPRAALAALVESCVAADVAKTHGLLDSPSVQWSTRTVLAETRVRSIRDEAEAKGPPSDEEVQVLTAKHWRDVDAGESVRVLHVVALRPAKNDAAKVAAAKALMDRLQGVLAKADGDAEFERIAKEATAPGVELKVERLSPFLEDGRTVEGPESTMDAAFTKATFAIHAPNQTSPVVESAFGWHVIRVLEHLPARHVPLEERRAAFASEARKERAATALAATVSRLRAETKPQVDSAVVDGLVDLVERVR